MIAVQRIADRYNISRHLPQQSVWTPPNPIVWPDWNTFLHQLCDGVDEHNEFNEILRHRKWLEVVRFYEGQQGGYIDADGKWQTVSRRPGDAIYISNIFQYFVNILLKEVLRSNGQLSVKAVGDRFELEFGARVFAEIFAAIQKFVWTPQEKNRDARYAILCGNAFTRTTVVNDYDRTTQRPRYEMKQVALGGGVFTCTRCDAMGEEAHLKMGNGGCPYCGAPSSAVAIRRGAKIELPELVGYDTMPGARIDTRVLSPFAVKLDTDAEDLESSQFLRVSQMVSLEVLRAHYPWAALGSEAASDESHWMRKSLRESPGNWNGRGTVAPLSQPDQGKCEQNEYYFEPSQYVNYEVPADELLADGTVLKKGTRAIDLYPRGMKVIRANGLLIAVDEGRKNPEFTQWVWDMNPTSVYGLGVEHAIESNRARNELMSLAKAIVLHHAAFSTIINQKKIKRSALLGKPGHVAIMEKPGPNDNPGNYIFQPQLKDFSPGNAQLLEQQKRDMEMETGGTLALDTMTASQTLGEVQIKRDAAISALIPRLINREDRNVKLAYQWAELLAADPEMAAKYYEEISDYSEYEIESFRQIVPKRHLNITTLEGSYIPRSELERRAMAIEVLSIGGLPGGVFNPMIPEPVRKRVLEYAQLPFESEENAVHERAQRMEIRQLLEIAQKVQQLDETTLAEIRMLVPVRLREEDHKVHQNTILRFLRTDAGRRLNDVARAILTDHWSQHLEALLYQQQEQMAVVGQQQMAAQTMMPAAQPSQ